MPCHAEDHSAFIFSVSSAISASTAGLSLIFSCWLTCSAVPPAFFSTNASICRNFLFRFRIFFSNSWEVGWTVGFGAGGPVLAATAAIAA